MIELNQIFQIFPTDASEVETELPTNFMDLPVEIRLNIIEQLHLNNLIRVRKSLPEDRYLIEGVFRKMFKNHSFRIFYDGDFREARISYDNFSFENIPFGVLNDNFKEILEFLKYFGHCITKL